MLSLRNLRRQRARRSRGGIALIVVIAAVMFLTVLVTDIDFGSRVRYIAAAHTRDGSQAYWIANSGMSLFRLVLMGNKQMGTYLTKNKDMCSYVSLMGVSCSDPLLTFLPFINTGMMRSMLVGGGDVEDEDVDQLVSSGQASEKTTEESREGGSRFGKKNFLDFTGDFTTSAKGEDCKVNISALADHKDTFTEDPTYKMLDSLMSGEDNEQWLQDRNLTKLDLIGNLADWVDTDSEVASGNGGYEDGKYSDLPSPYMTKNAPFDSTQEIRLVEGWQDSVFERWGDKLTIYGSKKINITCADTEVLKMMLRAYSGGAITTDAEADHAISLLAQWKANGNVIASCTDFKTALTQEGGYTLSSDFDNSCTARNTVYTVTSTGVVGSVQVTITAVIDQSNSDAGRVKYWRVE